jgi:CRISPR system Cascade subunit CasB
MSDVSVAKTRKAPEEVVEFVERLATLERGQLATLKRNAGNTLGESRNAMGLFYRILPPQVSSGRNEEVYFLVATLYGLDAGGFSGDFGASMRAVNLARKDPLAQPGAGAVSGIDRRMSVLLDSEFDRVDGKPGGGELAYRLRQCVKLAASAEVGIHWALLLDDLTRWQYPEKRVQKRWARSYYSEIVATEQNSEGGQG